MKELINIYKDAYSQSGKILGFEHKILVSDEGVVISYYETKVQYCNGEVSIHIYYPDKKLNAFLDVWVVFDCLVVDEVKYIIHIY
ncbi:hypothetical protein [Pantoea agglomerans]|uniref:hypothetical protein n=1 Tax=Enterobacter agglomerans TaxID=549 RepID=UPI003B9E5231